MKSAINGGGQRLRSRTSLWAEILLIAGLALAMLLWIIPAQTSEGGIGLSPAFLPNVCTLAVGLLVVVDGALRTLRRTPTPAYSEGWRALFRIGGIAILGALTLRWGGIVACGGLTTGAGQLILGERRPLVIATTSGGCMGVLWLIFA